MSAHDPCGPSTLARRAACPGSLAAELPLWDTPEEADADQARGTHRHAIAARGLIDPGSRIAGLAELADEEDRALVQAWWEFWAKSLRGCDVAGAGVESAVSLLGGRHGTCDAWAATDGGLVVADLKGQPQGAHGNLQLLDYAAGLLSTLPYEADDRVVLAIVSRAGADEWSLTVDDVRAGARRIAAVIAAAKSPDAPRHPGPHCTYCRARDACPKRREVAAEVVTYSGLMADPVATLLALPAEQRTDLLDRLTLAADRLGEARDAIKTAIRDGAAEVPGYRAVPSTRQEWANPAEARAALLVAAAGRGVPAEELTPLVGVTKAAQLLGKNAVEPLTERKPGTPSVRRMKATA